MLFGSQTGLAANTVLVSNLGEPGFPSPLSILSNQWVADSFVTGNQTAILEAASVQVLNGVGHFWVVVYADNNGVPGLPLQNGLLSGLDSPGGRATFYALGGVRLAPNTRYWLACESNAGGGGWGYGWYAANSAGYTGYPGWELLPWFGSTSDGGASWHSFSSTQLPYLELSGTVLEESLPAVSIDDGVAAGGGSDTDTLSFTVRLSRPSPLPVSVQFKTVAVWADTNALDPSTGTLAFAPGDTNLTLNVTITGNPGTNQTYRVQLFDPTNAVLANFEAIGVISNDAPLPEAFVLSGTVRESNVQDPHLLAMVRLSRTNALPASVQFSTVGLTAIAGQDFVPTNGTLAFSTNSPLTQWVPIRVRANILPEPDKTLQLQLSDPTNCVISSTEGILTIANDDGLPGVVDHFSIVSSTQALAGIPCPVTVTALDADGNVVTNFSDRVFMMAGYSNLPPQHFGFEEGDFSQWQIVPGTYQPGPYEIREFDTTGSGATNRAFRISPNIGSDGIQRMVSLAGGTGYYISASFAQALDAGPDNGDSVARITINGAEMAVAPFGRISSGEVQRTNLAFYYYSGSPASRVFGLFFDRGYFEVGDLGVYADDLVISPAPFTSVWSGAFTNGSWSGTVVFPQALTDVVLFGEDVDGHSGGSAPVIVLPTPNLAVGCAVSLGVARVGEPLTVTVWATNSGSAPASGVVVSNSFSSQVLIASASSTLGSCAVAGSSAVCNISSLAAGQTATITLTARATDTNVCSFAAAISGPDPDPDLANNSSGLSFSVGLPGLRSASLTVQGTPGGTNLVFPVWLGGPFVQPVTVQYHTLPAVAPSPADFVPTNGTLVFEPGVANLEVRVSVLDDGVYEGVQYCDLVLENPVNAVFLNGTAFDGTIVDNDPPPVFSIDDVSVVEGDSGETDAAFAVHLAGATALPASVQFATADGTAVAGSDYFATNGTLTFGPGTNFLTLHVRVRGDTVNESNEVFFVNLTAPTDATIARSQAVGTIVNDDLVAGRLDHFSWSPVFSPQVTNRPIHVSLAALDAFGQVATNFAGTVPLNAVAAGGATNLGLAPTLAGPFVAGTWTGDVSFTNTGAQVVLMAEDSQEHVGASNPFNVLAKFPLGLALPPAATEGDGTLVDQGRVWFPQPETNDVQVPLSTTNVDLITVPASVLIPAGQTSAVFSISVLENTLLDGTRSAYVSTVSAHYSNATASVQIYDNETASLGVTLPAQVAEGSHSQGTVTISSVPDRNVAVLLSSSNPGRLQVPSSVTIPQGATNSSFDLYAPDNSLLDGDEPATVTARVQNWTSGSAPTLVTDNEPHTLQLFTARLQNGVAEGMGTVTNGIYVRLAATTTSDVVVNLGSSDITTLVVPASVVVPAGTNLEYFNFTVLDDSKTNGTRSVSIVASSPGFTNATLNIVVRDNDLHHFTFSNPVSTTVTSGIPFQVTATARDVGNSTLPSYNSVILLAAIGTKGPFSLELRNAGGWTFGTWSGSLVIYSPYAQTLSLKAIGGNGNSGLSAPFDLVLPASNSPPRILESHIVGSDVALRFETVPGWPYTVEAAPGLSQPSWQPVTPETLGDGRVTAITNFGAAGAPSRFYRLHLNP